MFTLVTTEQHYVDIIQRKRGTALHRQIFLVLKERLSAHRYDQGLPTEEALTLEFSVSRATVRSALADLESAGLIRRVHGKGSFPVTQGPVHVPLSSTTYLERLKQTSTETRIHMVEFSFDVPPNHVQQNLLIGSDERALHVVRTRNKGRVPVMLLDAYVPERFSEGLTRYDLLETPLYQVLISRGLAFGHVVQEISACIADPARAQALKVDVGIALIQLNRTIFDEKRVPIQYLEMFLVPERTKVFQQLPVVDDHGFEGGTLVHM